VEGGGHPRTAGVLGRLLLTLSLAESHFGPHFAVELLTTA
jgi:hypothetical protein